MAPFGYVFRKRYQGSEARQRMLSRFIAKALAEREIEKYSPDQPRDERGRWTSGGGGALDEAAVRRENLRWKSEQPMHSVQDHLAASPRNQAEIARVGEQIARQTGTTFSNTGAKKQASLEDKIYRRGKPPNTVTDAVRAGFVVKEPGDANRVIDGLRQHFEVLDEGWKRTPVGYFDRTALIRFTGGQIGEIQFWNAAMKSAKDDTGHSWYKEWQKIPDGTVAKRQWAERMRRLYGSVALPPQWDRIRRYAALAKILWFRRPAERDPG